MSYDGSHLICKKHEEKTIYCDIKLVWVCLTCELEKKEQQE